MELTVTKRAAGKKSETKRIRREGNIPAVLYSKGKKGEEFVVDGIAFKKIINKIQSGTLSTAIFSIKNKSKTHKAIIKDVQYDIVTYEVIHLDFEELHDDIPVNIKIPVQCVGAVDCVGVKLGGFLRQVIHHLKVRCLPKDIPPHLELEVREMNIGQTKKLKDIPLPAGLRPQVDLKEVAVVIAKR